MMIQVQVLISDPAKGHLRLAKVTKIFAYNFSLRRDKDMGMISLCLLHQDILVILIAMLYDLFGYLPIM